MASKIKPTKREFSQLIGAAVAHPSFSLTAHAQAYPTRPVRLIVGFPPGGGADTVSRIVGASLSDRLGQQVIIENRPGAGSNLATQVVVNSPPDGYTLLYYGGSAIVSKILYSSLPFDLVQDIAPVSGLVDFPMVMVSHPSFRATTVADLIAQAKANPARISMASFGTGTASHLAGELFKMMAGVKMVHVPYRGGAPMITDLLGGQVQVAFDVMVTSLPHIRTGALRALGVTGAKRFYMLPDVPSIGETVAGCDASTWAGVGSPRGTPPNIIARLNDGVKACLNDPVVRSRLADVGTVPLIVSPEQLGAHVTAETVKWSKVVKTAGIRAE
jgi:tripartite-type tricarboxylate transporter receptor subunit TctC